VAPRLHFGLNGAAPASAKAVWGARWIYPDDQLWDRQDCVGGGVNDRRALIAWLNLVAGRRARERARKLANGYAIAMHSDRTVTLYEDARGLVVGNPLASERYLYVAAWLKARP
jgi:hypothetical protein